MNKGVRTKLRKTVPLWVVILIVVAFSTVVVAITITWLPEEHISLWSGTTTPSNFTIQDQIIHFRGPNEIFIKLTLKNTYSAPSTASTANVTVFIENSSGNNLMNETQSTGSVMSGSTVTLNFDFQGTGITAEYASDFIEIIDQPA